MGRISCVSLICWNNCGLKDVEEPTLSSHTLTYHDWMYEVGRQEGIRTDERLLLAHYFVYTTIKQGAGLNEKAWATGSSSVLKGHSQRTFWGDLGIDGGQNHRRFLQKGGSWNVNQSRYSPTQSGHWAHEHIGPWWDPVVLRRSIIRRWNFSQVTDSTTLQSGAYPPSKAFECTDPGPGRKRTVFGNASFKRESEPNHKPPTFLGQKHYEINHFYQRSSNTYKHHNWQCRMQEIQPFRMPDVMITRHVFDCRCSPKIFLHVYQPHRCNTV